MNNEIAALEKQLEDIRQKIAQLRQDAPPVEVPDYTFETLTGPVTLSSLFAGKDTLFAIHNMGQACRYCTLWADGLNGFVPHLEDRFALVLLSKDTPEVQRRFAQSRGWRYRMASHGGGAYIQEQDVVPGDSGNPGMVCYQREGSKILRKSATTFGPGDDYCALWHILSLAGMGLKFDEWTPQYTYWTRPERKDMEDGGQNVQ